MTTRPARSTRSRSPTPSPHPRPNTTRTHHRTSRTIEDATALAIDYQLAFKESAIAGATDNVFGGLDVDVPLGFKVNGFYVDGKKYPAGRFQQGLQRLNGVQVIQFIKTVPVEVRYDAKLEHNARKHL